jgi:hypothetical protein
MSAPTAISEQSTLIHDTTCGGGHTPTRAHAVGEAGHGGHTGSASGQYGNLHQPYEMNVQSGAALVVPNAGYIDALMVPEDGEEAPTCRVSNRDRTSNNNHQQRDVVSIDRARS